MLWFSDQVFVYVVYTLSKLQINVYKEISDQN